MLEDRGTVDVDGKTPEESGVVAPAFLSGWRGPYAPERPRFFDGLGDEVRWDDLAKDSEGRALMPLRRAKKRRWKWE